MISAGMPILRKFIIDDAVELHLIDRRAKKDAVG